MSDASDAAAEPTGPDAIKADIDKTRAELADTVDQLTDKLNVKAQAGRKADELKHTVAQGASDLKRSAPAPVQNALDSVGEKAGPVAARVNRATAPHRTQILAGLAGGAVVLFVVRRIRRRGDES